MITGTAPAAAPAAWQDAALCSTKIIDTRDEVDASGRAFVCYALEATGVPPGLPKEEMRWLVRKRYTEFYQFYKDLFAASKSVPEIATFKFPHKSLFHNHDPRTIERRKRSFEELMSLALAVQPALLLRFLSESAPEQCVLNSDSPARASSASPDLTRMISDTYADRVSGFGSPSSGPSIAEVDGENSIPMRPIPEDEPMEFSRALLRVRRIEATQLKKVDLLGDNDPFVTLAFDKWRGRTRTLTNGGQNVSWDLAGDKKFEFDVTMDAMERLELRLAAHDDNDISSSEEIGKGALSLSGILTRGMDVEISASVRLVDSKNRFAGHVVIYFDLVEHPEDIATNMRRMNETGVAISLFYIFLYEVCLLIYVLWSFDYSTLFDLLLFGIRRQLLRLMFCSQLMLILLVAFVYFHRFLGWALTAYLKSIMGTPSGGYNMAFKWLSLRLGLDESEIVLNNFVWHNTPVFKDSPYFVKIHRMCIRFDPSSIYPAIMRNTPISITDIEISGVTAYVERDTVHGLNIWACMGAADQPPEDRKIESAVVGNVASAMKKIKKADEKEMEAGGNKSADRNENKKGEESDEEFFGNDDDDKIIARPVPKLNRESSVASLDPNAKTNGWGVPFKFITGRLEIRNLRAYAQDYLNAKHTSYNNLTSIRIKRLEMSKKELCDYSSSKGYRGVFLDDLVWKLIGELITSLLASNSGSLALLAASAAANNTFALAIGTTGMAAKGVIESLHNFNPNQVMGSTIRKTSYLFRSQSKIEQEPELKELGYNSVVGRIISVRNLKRKGQKVDSLYCTVTLVGYESFDGGFYKTYVRSGQSDLTAAFNEAFELRPLVSMSQSIVIKVFDKKLTRVTTSDKLIVEATITNLRNISIIGRDHEVVNWIEMSSDGMFDDTGDIQIGLQLK